MNIENNVTELKYFSYDLSDDYCKNKKRRLEATHGRCHY